MEAILIGEAADALLELALHLVERFVGHALLALGVQTELLAESVGIDLTIDPNFDPSIDLTITIDITIDLQSHYLYPTITHNG